MITHILNNPVQVLINWLLMACGHCHFEARQHLKADITSVYPVDLKSVEPIQKHVNKCEQRIIPELNWIILLKLCHEWYTTISVWARRNLIQNGWILSLKRKTNPCDSRERLCDVRAFQFSPSLLQIWLPVEP